MKVAVLSDIHSNRKQLERCVERANAMEIDKVLCLGDIVGYGYDPNGSIEFCRETGIECILGNHDAGVIGKLPIQWFAPHARKVIESQRETITEKNKQWLRSLPYTIELKCRGNKRIGFAHGTFVNPEVFDYVQEWGDALVEMERMKSIGLDILFVGHTHLAKRYVYKKGEQIPIKEIWLWEDETKKVSLAEDSQRMVINVGSCGYPRIQQASIFGILDTEALEWQYQAIPFYMEEYIKEMTAAQVPLDKWVQGWKPLES